MGRYTGPKGKINRRLGAMIYENSGAARALERRDYPPGMHTRRGKVSNYGQALMEKQKIKHYYLLGEKQLRTYFDRVSRMHGNTGEQLLLLCERRLDNVVRRAGFALTRCQARQGIVHCHFCVNGKRVNKPSFLVRPGDVITVRERPNLQKNYRMLIDSQSNEIVSWIAFEHEQMRATVTGYPGPADISLPVQIAQVVEFMSR